MPSTWKTEPVDSPAASAPEVLWFARLERRYHAWRERRARHRGRLATVVALPGYGSPTWVRVVGRVMIPPRPRSRADPYQGVRGWRSFVAIPVGFARVQVRVGDQVHEVIADRGGVLDALLPARMEPGWRTVEITVDGQPPIRAAVFIVADDVRFGIVSDVDDTVMVTALPRPMLAAWNSFVVNEHARQHPGAPMVYLSTGAWNIGPTLDRFLRRHLFPPGAMLLTDWGPPHDRWFRSGQEHKRANLARLAEEFPRVQWLLIGDDGQHDDAIYTAFAGAHPDNVAAVAIRRLTPAEAVLAGGRTTVDDHSAAGVPWVTGDDGAELMERLTAVGLMRAGA